MSVIVFVSIVLASATSLQSNNTMQERATQNGLYLEASVEPTKRRGQRTVLALRLKNERKELLHFWSDSRRPGICRSTLIDRSTGTAILPTRKGDGVLNVPTVDVGRAEMVKLLPGQSREWKIDLQECFDLKVGQYRLSTEIEIPNSGENGVTKLSIKRIEFEILR